MMVEIVGYFMCEHYVNIFRILMRSRYNSSLASIYILVEHPMAM
jgi:hypothetical protein